MTVSRKKDFIPGIFNYCDRWCERCEYTRLCRLAADLEKAERRRRRKGKDPADDSIDGAMEEVGRSFEVVARALRKRARKEGWDLDAIDTAAIDAHESDLRRRCEQHPLALEARQWCREGMKLVKDLQPLLRSEGEDLQRRGDFMDVQDEADSFEALAHAMEVVAFDSTLVAAKMRRAIDGLLESADETDFMHEIGLEDANGSAAVILRCLKRDRPALVRIYEHDERLEEQALGLLARLDRMEKGLAEVLPGALTFVWPPKAEE